MTTKIIPAILANNISQFKSQWQKVASGFSYLQIDIMDGRLVKTRNEIKPQQIKTLTKNHKLEIHLMVKDVGKYLKTWSQLKNVQKIIWHYEACTDLVKINKFLKFLKSKKIKTGLAINPPTSLTKIYPLIKNFDTILIMGVTPGKMGQKFQTSALIKIKTLRKKYSKLNIAVDGGVNDKNFKKIKTAGANLIAIGNYLQKSKDLKTALNKLK